MNIVRAIRNFEKGIVCECPVVDKTEDTVILKFKYQGKLLGMSVYKSALSSNKWKKTKENLNSWK
jgi:hypothetical protein